MTKRKERSLSMPGAEGGGVVLIEELHDVETALVDVEVDVAHLEVRGHQLPLPHIGVRLLDGGPCACADAASVRARKDSRPAASRGLRLIVIETSV